MIGHFTHAELGEAIMNRFVLVSDHYWMPGMASWGRVNEIFEGGLSTPQCVEPAKATATPAGLFSRLCSAAGLAHKDGIWLSVLCIVTLIGLTVCLALPAEQANAIARKFASSKRIEEQASVSEWNADAMYKFGLSVDRVRSASHESLPFYTRAAELGHPKAQVKLGIYYQTYATPKDFSASLKWLTKAASRETPEAFFWLGQLYVFDETPFKDHAEACKWYNLGIASDDPKIAETCRNMLQIFRANPNEWNVTEAQQAEGIRRAKEYMVKYPAR
jgi:Sel1 repeat